MEGGCTQAMDFGRSTMKFERTARHQPRSIDLHNLEVEKDSSPEKLQGATVMTMAAEWPALKKLIKADLL